MHGILTVRESRPTRVPGTNGFEEEFTANVPTKAQAIRAARNQAILEANRAHAPIFGNRAEGYELVGRNGPVVRFDWQRCSQEPCSAYHEDSPSLPDLPLP